MQQSVIHYVLSRLHQLGITDVFGVAGDYAFPINDAICEDKHLRWIGCSNELNARRMPLMAMLVSRASRLSIQRMP